MPFIPAARRLVSDLMMGVVFGDTDALLVDERTHMLELLDVYFAGFTAWFPLPFFGLTTGERAAAARTKLLGLMTALMRKRKRAMGAFFDGNLGVPCLLDSLLSTVEDVDVAADTMLHVLMASVLLMSNALSLLVKELHARPGVRRRIVAEYAASQAATTYAPDALYTAAADAGAELAACPRRVSIPEAARFGAARGSSVDGAPSPLGGRRVVPQPPPAFLSGGWAGRGTTTPSPSLAAATAPSPGGRVDVLGLIGGLPYLDGVVMEALRLNPSPYWRFRTIVRRFRAGGFTLPRDWALVLDHAAVMGDAREFPAPTEFWPERYAAAGAAASGTGCGGADGEVGSGTASGAGGVVPDEEGDGRGSPRCDSPSSAACPVTRRPHGLSHQAGGRTCPRHFIAFGSGRRQCPAPGLAVTTLKLFALLLCRDFDFELSGRGGGVTTTILPAAPFAWTITRKAGGRGVAAAAAAAAAASVAGTPASALPSFAAVHGPAHSRSASLPSSASASARGLSVPIAAAVDATAAAVSARGGGGTLLRGGGDASDGAPPSSPLSPGGGVGGVGGRRRRGV